MTNQFWRHLGIDPAVLCLVLSVIALGHSVQIANGFYHPVALVWLTCAGALCVAGVLLLRSSAIGRPHAAEVIICATMAAGIAWQVVALLTTSPGMYLDERTNIVLFKTGVIVEAALVGAGVANIRPFRRFWFPAVLAVQLLIGVWMIRASPSPRIDVVVVHRAAISALLQGRDPYRITFDNIYGAGSGYYNPRDVVRDQVIFGYPYPPLNLLFAVPGQAWAGDYRYGEVVALVIGAAFIGYAQSAMTARLAASLLLTTPRVFFVLEQGWTEPIAVLMLALTVFCLTRKPALAPWAGGLLLVTKQYLALAGPPLLRFATSWRARSFRFVLSAVIAALVVTVPFALRHPHAFINAVVQLQTREPFRIESLSYLAWAARAGWGTGSFMWSIAAASVALIVAMIRTPNTPAAFAASVALSALAMFAFGSKAFCNYYFFVVAAMCCAIAVSPTARERAAAASIRAPRAKARGSTINPTVEASPNLRAGDSPLGPRLPV